jgi:hypothetical protein
MLLSFQRPSRPVGKGIPSEGRTSGRIPKNGPVRIAPCLEPLNGATWAVPADRDTESSRVL